MHAAGIVADHSAKVAVFMRGRIRTKSEIEFVGAVAKLIEYAAGLHPRIFFLRIDLNNLVQVFGEINDHGDVAGLPAEAGAATAWKQRCFVLASDGNGLNNFFYRFRNYYADGNLAVVRAIDGIERARARVKADFACDGGVQLGGKDINAIASFGGVPIRGLRWHAPDYDTLAAPLIATLFGDKRRREPMRITFD